MPQEKERDRQCVTMSGRITTPKAMTTEQLEAEIKAQEKALEEASKESAVPEKKPTPEPEKVETKEETPPQEEVPAEETQAEPAPEEKTPSEFELFKAKMAEQETRIVELTKRVRDDDGRRGGELSALRAKYEKAQSELEELRKNPPKPAAPPEPDPLESEYPEVAKGMERRTRPVMEAALRAEQEAKAVKEELQRLRETQSQRDYASMLSTVNSVVPKREEYDNDPAFVQWCKGTNEGAVQTRQEVFQACSRTLNPTPAIQLYQQWERSKTKAEPAKVVPAKPKKEDLVDVPRSTNSPDKTAPKKISLEQANRRIKEIEKKVYGGAGATKEETAEHSRLLDAIEKGEIT
jgi:hypothetical protein